MKTKIIVAFVATSLIITFISCSWFKSNDEPESTGFNIEGQWIIDSIENKSSDSSKNLGILLLALAAKESGQPGIQFNNDSTFHFINSTDSATGKYYLSEDQNCLFVKEDSVFHQLNFLTRSDSTFIATTTDSVVYHLRKK